MKSPSSARRAFAAAAVSLGLCWAQATLAQPYSFATFTFDQQDTPDVVAPLANGTFDGAVVTSAANAGPSIGIGFPTDRTSFDDARTLGRLIGLYAAGSRGINLPRGDNGSLARSGFVLSWSGGRKLQNLAGDDFVVFESASNSTSPEAFLVQVYSVTDAAWSDWYYEPADSFQLYNGETVIGAFATGFDLSDLGLADGDEIDRIRLVNATDEDRTVAASRTGFMLPEDNGATSTYTPDPGPLSGYSSYGASSLDPDPIYVAALHTATAAACGNSIVEPGAGEQCDPGADVPGDCCTAACLFEGNGTLCDDGLYCTISDTCAAGSCTGSARDCNDGNECTADSCDDGTSSCVNDPAPQNGQVCDDAAFCTVNDVCSAGTCGGSANPCDDANPCTADSCDSGSDSCVNDGAALEATSCDDGDACTSATTCSAGVCSNGTPVLVCGDANVCAPESCDDGNSDELDGCSSGCQLETPQTETQRNCIKALNVAGDGVAKAQAKLAAACVSAASKDSVIDAQACIVADVRGLVLRAQQKVSRTATDVCTVTPDFGEDDAAVVNSGAVAQGLGLVADLFGADLDAAVILRGDDKFGAFCQKAILASTQAWAAKARRMFLVCKKDGLLGNTIRSQAALEGCVEGILGDTSGKLNRVENRIAKALTGPCAGVDLAAAFPGACAAAPDPGACVIARAACRSCLTLNAIDALAADCDSFDDGVLNTSCP